jgi:hypothetical protein
MQWPPANATNAEIENQSPRERFFFSAAERELSAFFTAVKNMFGADQACKSAIHWIEELESMDWPTEDAMPNWRQATMAASTRLAADLAIAKQTSGELAKRAWRDIYE